MKLAALLLACLAAARAQTEMRGFSAEQAKAQRSREDEARRLPEPGRIRSYMERMSKEPHAAGSPASKRVAEYAAELLRGWGLDTTIEEFEALLPYPTVRVLEMEGPVKFRAKLREPAISDDKDSSDKGQLPTYNAYSASGDVRAPLVYVNYGVPEDYDELWRLGIDVKGKIVIARYGKSWRGTKPKVAYEHGAVGCLIYSDPRDDGYFQGDVYPQGPFRPMAGVQRGSVMDMPVHVGDPLSPGWASEKGGKKLEISQAVGIMKIPVLPISYQDAEPLLANLEGPVAPESWRGALPITYHVGSGPATVHLKLDFDWTTKPVYNVIATIPGAVYPDEWVIYGNHHDAWVNGAQDPSSGASALLETARTLGAFRKKGWKPQRSIRFALWDAEEFGLIGSTEWVEKHQEEISAKTVVYFNSDSNGKGTLGVGGSPSLQTFITQVMRDVDDPVTGESLLAGSRSKGGSKPSGYVGMAPLGAGSDYVAFVHHIGVGSLNLGFSGADPGGVYHSIYDSFHWFTRFSDGEFIYGKAMAQVMTTAIMRMADAPLLPFEFGTLVKTVRGYVDEIEREKDAGKVDLTEVKGELGRLQTAVEDFEQQVQAGKWIAAAPSRMARLNGLLYQSERSLTQAQGLPGRSWYRYQLSAPGMYTGYGAKTLPGIREAVELGRWDEAQRESASVAGALRTLRGRVEDATRLLKEL
ncbi:MAG: M28 family metallopeptidase [Bryobacteraceae bacterium]